MMLACTDLSLALVIGVIGWMGLGLTFAILLAHALWKDRRENRDRARRLRTRIAEDRQVAYLDQLWDRS